MLAFVFFSMGCAPRQESDAPAEDPKIPDEIKKSPGEEPADPGEEAVPGPTPPPKTAAKAPTGGGEPDWSQRYYELKDKYQSSFSPPEPGQPIEVRISSDRIVRGTLVAVTEADIVLDLGNGRITLPPDSLHPLSAKSFFASYYGAFHARKQALEEYQHWRDSLRSVPKSPDQNPTSNPPAPAEAKEPGDKEPPWFVPQDSDDPMFKVVP